MVRTKRYGFWRFTFDFLFGCLTMGVWWFYLLFKFLRNNS
jgi:hypothetical protein